MSDAVLARLRAATDRVYLLDTSRDVETLTWAIQRGFEVDGTNRLLITRIHSYDATLDVLKLAGYSSRWLHEEFAARVQALPVTLDLDPLATVGLLRALTETRAFDYEVNP